MVVVVDRNFGEKLVAVPREVPVWNVYTPTVARRVRKERPASSHLNGITTYNDVDVSPEESLLNQLPDIDLDLDHGPYSTKRPYTELEVIGTPLSDKLKIALADYGFGQFSTRSKGFLTIREDQAGRKLRSSN